MQRRLQQQQEQARQAERERYALEAVQRERQLRQQLLQEQAQSQERLIANAVAAALRAASNGPAEPAAPVVQAVPVGAAKPSENAGAYVVGVDQSVESPAVPSHGTVNQVSAAVDTRRPQPGRQAASTVFCSKCWGRVVPFRDICGGMYCPDCREALAVGSE